MPYEIERRVNLWLEDRLPSEAKLERVYGGRDYYFTSSSPFLRVRDMKLTYQCGLNLTCPQSIQRQGKKSIDKEGWVRETEKTVDASEALRALNERFGKPKVILEGCRREFSLGDLSVCSDYVMNLGYWTEIEKVTKSRSENSQALKKVIEAFSFMGVGKGQLVEDIYPVLLLKKTTR